MKKNPQQLLAASLWVFICTVAIAAQTTTAVTGSITDPQGAVIVGATVTLYERDNRLRLTTVTDAAGSYRLARLAPGEYIIEAEASGFARAARHISVKAGGTTTLDLSLGVASISTEVVVTASGTALSVDEVSKAITVVDAEEIQLRDELSIAESLRTVPGLRVSQRGGPGSFTSIRIRGLRNEDTAILIDGLRFRDASTIQGDATSFLEDLLVVNTDRLEVLRGSGSSLYGTNAIGGVVNVVTDRGGGSTHGHLHSEGGSLGLFRGRAQLAGGARQDRFGYSAGVTHLNVTDGVDGDDAARNTSGQGFVQYHFTPSVSLGGRIFAGDSFLQLNDSPFVASTENLPATGSIRAVPISLDRQRRLEAGQQIDVGNATFVPALNDPDNRRSAHFFSGAVMFSHRLSEAASYRLSYQGVVTSRTFRDGPAGVRFEPPFVSASQFDGRIDTFNARTDVRLGRFNLLSAGYEFERETFEDLSTDENPDPAQRVNAGSEIKQQSHTVFAQNQLRTLDNRFQLSAAVRVQTFDLSEPEFRGGTTGFAGVSVEDPDTAYTGDGSISYFFAATNTKLRAHVGNGYRAPSLFEWFGAIFFFGSFSTFGDPRLRPERSVAFDAGIDQTFERARLRASMTTFYTRLQEVIFFDFSGVINPETDPFGRFGGYRNTGGGLARGLEIGLTAAPWRTLDVFASYTYTNADERTPSIQDFGETLGISDHMFTLVVNQHIARRLDITFDLFAASDYAFPFFAGDRTRAFIFDGPIKADLSVSYTVPISDARSIRFYGKVDNVFDRAYFENGFRAPGATGVGGVLFRF